MSRPFIHASATCMVALLPLGAGATPFTDIIAAMDEGDWAQVSTNSFSDVWTPFGQRPTTNNPGAIIRAWSSFAWDSTRGEIILWGGGHANYGGNEVYTWQSSTQQWTRGSLPSALRQVDSDTFVTVDGPLHSPIASHTYDNQEYLPVSDRFITFGGAAYTDGGRFVRTLPDGTAKLTGPYLWDPSKADPDKVGGLTGSQVNPAANPGVVGGEMWQNRDIGVPAPIMPKNTTSDAVVEGGKDVVYFSGVAQNGTIAGLYKYTINDLSNPAADTWQQIGLGSGDTIGSDDGGGALDVARNLFVRSNGSEFIYWNLNEPGVAAPHVVTPTVVGAGGSLAFESYGLEWDPNRGWFVVWVGNGDVWYLKPPTTLSDDWILEKAPDPNGPTPLISDNTAFTGVLGKWKYDPINDVFIGLNDDIHGDVWVYKPFDWEGGVEGPIVVATAPGSLPLLAGALGGFTLLYSRRGSRRRA